MKTCLICKNIIPDEINQCEVCGSIEITFENEPKLSIEEVKEIFKEMADQHSVFITGGA